MADGAMSPVRTLYFDSCRGVFQGGGCRGAALAGAYQAAVAAGVHFSEVAGTSAGSILAALIGAGASPEFVVEKIRQLRFPELLRQPQPQDGFRGWAFGLGSRLLSALGAKEIGNLVRYGGFYSSAGIEEWLDNLLAELLPQAKRPICFQDLVMNTYVVATDLISKSPRVWSSLETPGDSVAFAVRASCSIPIFFQPVIQGENRLVDGGVLSNLPAFVFARRGRRDKDFRPLGGLILAFQLQEGFERPTQWSPVDFLKRVVDTAVSGATDLQAELTHDTHSIFVRTGTVRATDFEKITPAQVATLIENGRNATVEFIGSEATRLRRRSDETKAFQNLDELYAEIVHQSESPSSQIIVAQPSTEWYWKLFPTVLYWRRQGTRVQVLVQGIDANDHETAREKARRENLAGLGVEVTTIAKLPWKGLLFLREDFYASAAIVSLPPSEYAPIAVCYEGKTHQEAVHAIREGLKTYLQQPALAFSSAPTLSALDPQTLYGYLKRGVVQYSKPEVTIKIAELPVERVMNLTKFLHAYKYRQIIRLAEHYKAMGMTLFEPATVGLPEGKISIVAPPVIEAHGDLLVGIEGNTRTYFCWRNGVKIMRCLLVEGVDDPPPGDPVALRRVNVVTGGLRSEERMPGFDHARFRRIEGAVHPVA